MIIKNGLKWGVYLGMTLVIGTQILTWLGLGLTNWFVGLTFVSIIVIVSLSTANIKKINDDKLPFKTAALLVAIMILVSSYIFQLYMFIYINYIDPGWTEMVAESWTNTMQESELSSEVIHSRIESFRKSYKPLNMFTTEILRYGIVQFIIGLIVASVYVFKGRNK